MRNIKLLLAFALTILLTSCERDNVDDWGATNKIKFSFVTAAKSNVDITTRAVSEAAESDVTSLYVFVFQDGEKKEEGYITDLTLTNSGEYTRTYTGVLEKTNTIGAVKVYAVANPSTEMWNDLSGLQAAAGKGEAEFKKALYSVSQEFVEPLGTNITLIGMAGSDGSANIASDGSLGTRIILKRPYASVAFNFNNGAPAASDTDRAGHTVSFTPTSYDIYNIPLNSALFEGAEVVGLNHFDRVDQQFGTLTPNSFSFYMIENIQEAKQEVTTYHDRDEKDSHGAFVNAPDEATYVRVYGKYVENDENGKVVLQGDVNYTIHLGDFSGGDNNQYSVKRNYKYTYNVTINGVEQIIVEATAEDDTDQKYQHGAEGYIINTEGVEMVYNLDAHYEDALIGINTTSFDKEGHGFILRVSTPYMTEAAQNEILIWEDFEKMDEDTFKKTYDIDWIKFYPVTKTSERTPYPNKKNQDKLMNVYELYHELYKIADEDDKTTSSLADYVNESGMIYFMAFVDEYFYTADPLDGGATNWTEFVNAKPRSMYMLQDPKSSTDGNSTYATVLCAFEQKSIQTMFKMNGSINAYGIEWYDETENANLATFSDGVDNANGYNNYFTYLANKSTWDTYVDESALRYGLDGQPNGNTYSVLTSANGEYACMQRNRDLDGDGSISDNEKRWYLASSDQYVQMWIGETAIDRQARMSGVVEAKKEEDYEKLSHYYTSSDNAHRIYWAAEAGSVGKYDTNWMGTYHKVRCVRTLNISDPSAEPADIYTRSGSTITMSNLNSKAYRESGSMVGEYAAHNELDERRNQIPYSIEVADGTVNQYIINADQITYASPMVSYISGGYPIAYTDVAVRTDGVYSTANTVSGSDNTIVLTFNYDNQKFILSNDYLKTLTYPKRVQLTYDDITVTYKTKYSSNDVTSKALADSNFGFCDYNGSWSHSAENGCYAVIETMNTANGSLTGIGFNMAGDINTHSWCSDISYGVSEVVITITNLKVVADTSEEQKLQITTSDDSAIKGATFYYTSTATFATTNPITLDENNCVAVTDIALPAYIWAKGNDGNNSFYTYISNKYDVTRYETADKDGGEVRGPVFNIVQSTTENICAEHYSQEADGSDLGQWRVPNERELQAMGLNKFCTSNTLSRTTFSPYPNVGPARYGFWWDAGSQIQTLEASGAEKPEDNTGYIRCVRDVAVTESTTAETDGTAAGSYSDKGNLTSAN